MTSLATVGIGQKFGGATSSLAQGDGCASRSITDAQSAHHGPAHEVILTPRLASTDMRHSARDPIAICLPPASPIDVVGSEL